MQDLRIAVNSIGHQKARNEVKELRRFIFNMANTKEQKVLKRRMRGGSVGPEYVMLARGDRCDHRES